MGFNSPTNAVVAQAPAQTSTTTIQTATIAEFVADFGFTQINPTIGASLNGYPFVTFITAANKAETIYFAKKLVSKYPKGTVIGAGFFKDLQIAKVTNAKGELRYKICSTGGNRLTIMDLL